MVPPTTPYIDPRRLVHVNPERATDVSSTDFPGHYPGEELDHAWSLHTFKRSLTLTITRLSTRSIEFDLIGPDASIANALRRTLIAEVPTIAIEHVYVANNTSVVQDEVLAQRLGLVPLNVDPELMEMRDSSNIATDRNTIVFNLSLTCTRNPKYQAPPTPSLLSSSSTSSTSSPYINSTLLSSHLTWDPQGEQSTLSEFITTPPAPTNPNIVLAKLRPGQEVDMVLHAVKGIGSEHAKWSPVATATYRLHPYITLTLPPSSNPKSNQKPKPKPNPMPPHLLTLLKSSFSPNVILTDPSTNTPYVTLSSMRKDTMSRNVFRHEEVRDWVKLSRVRDWFLFSIESEGPYAPERLVPAAIRVLRGRIANLRRAVDALVSQEGVDGADGEGGEGGGEGVGGEGKGKEGSGGGVSGVEVGDVVMKG